MNEVIKSENQILGKKVKGLRNHKFLSQEELAQKSGLSQSEISKIETGQFRGLNEETIKRLSKGLEITPEIMARSTRFASLFGQAEILPFGPIDDGPPFTAYFASALTGLSPRQEKEIIALDEKVNEVCKKYNAYSVALYRPREYTSPTDNADISPREVYETDRERVTTADLLILASIFPSLGAGMELQLAHQSCSSVILLRKKGQKLSRMVTGCPVPMEILEYNNLKDLEGKLIKAMNRVLPIIAQARLLHPQPSDNSSAYDLGRRLGQLRKQRNLSPESLAAMVGVDTPYIEALESRPEQVTNPSLRMLRHIARALHVTDSYLISGYVIPIHQTNPEFSKHYETLRTLAQEEKMPEDAFEMLWKTHVDKYQVEMSVLGVDRRAEVGDLKYWMEKYERLQKKGSESRPLFED
jgi:transcriptional regulator with XRE-family HTH domain